MSIKIKPSHKGLLHKKLGVPQGEKIPESKIQAAKRSKSPALRKEATFAQNFGHRGHFSNHGKASMDHDEFMAIGHKD